MRKPHPEYTDSQQEELTTEVIELSCEELGSLSRAFEMISQLCDSLQYEVLQESLSDIPEEEIN